MQTLQTIFEDIEIPPHRISLASDIVQNIAFLSEKRLKHQKQMFLLGTSISFVSLLLSGFFFGSSLMQSEFWSVLSVIFSDLSTVALYISDFVLLLLETLPMIPLLAILTPVFFLFLFLSLYSATLKSVRTVSY